MSNGYPDVPLEKHIAYEFADCCGVELDSIKGTLYLTQSELSYARSVIKNSIIYSLLRYIFMPGGLLIRNGLLKTGKRWWIISMVNWHLFRLGVKMRRY